MNGAHFPGIQASLIRYSSLTWKERGILLFASGLGAGWSPLASGTVGTLVAIPLYLFLLDPFNAAVAPLFAYFAIVAVFFVLGTMCATWVENRSDKKDPGLITIDEVVGFFLCLPLLPATWPWVTAAFFVFRLFDVWKPWPIRGLQRLRGGLGIMIDDVLAGVYTWIVLQAAHRIAS